MTVTEFKAQALKAVSEVSNSRETLVVTKRGTPIVQVVPYSDDAAEAVPDRLKHMFDFEEDIVSPLEAEIGMHPGELPIGHAYMDLVAHEAGPFVEDSPRIAFRGESK